MTELGEHWFQECLDALMERGFLQISGARDYVRLVADDEDQGPPCGGTEGTHTDAASHAHTQDRNVRQQHRTPGLDAAHVEVERLTDDEAQLETDALRLTRLRLVARIATDAIEEEIVADAVGRLKLHRGLRTLTPRLTTLALRYNADPGCYESRSVQAESARRRALRNLGFLRIRMRRNPT